MNINLSGVFNFFIAFVELAVIGALIFAAIEFISTDARFKKIAKIAVGGALVVMLMFAAKAVFAGGGGMNLTPAAFISFAVGVILTLVVWYVIDALLGWVAANWFPPLAGALVIVRFVIGAIVLVVILLIAANLLFGANVGGAGFHVSDAARPLHQHVWSAERSVPRLPSSA